jgi:hypothetical protein
MPGVVTKNGRGPTDPGLLRDTGKGMGGACPCRRRPEGWQNGGFRSPKRERPLKSGLDQGAETGPILSEARQYKEGRGARTAARDSSDWDFKMQNPARRARAGRVLILHIGRYSTPRRVQMSRL